MKTINILLTIMMTALVSNAQRPRENIEIPTGDKIYVKSEGLLYNKLAPRFEDARKSGRFKEDYLLDMYHKVSLIRIAN